MDPKPGEIEETLKIKFKTIKELWRIIVFMYEKGMPQRKILHRK